MRRDGRARAAGGGAAAPADRLGRRLTGRTARRLTRSAGSAKMRADSPAFGVLPVTRPLVLAFLLSAVCTATGAQDAPMRGFDSAGSDVQRSLEADFAARLDAADQDAWMRRLSERPHHVSSTWGRENAQFIRDRFAAWGYDAAIVPYRILFPVPTERRLEMTAPTSFTASLEEAPLAEDPSTRRTEELLPPYHAFSVDGDVEGELVFVNYGLEEDYDWLARNGIDVAGKIVIAKYGRSWRGIKPKIAAERGAIGTIIYSDPADDGYGRGDTYPDGPFKHPTGVQRGSVMDMPLHPGDVLTPGIGATEDAPRLDMAEVDVLTSIPVLPISYADAEPLLAALGGPVAPRDWFGQLPITYHAGPGPARVRLKVAFDWRMVEAHNVIATLEGDRFPDEWVMRGNHHDAWNHGAADPISGLVALMAEAKAIGELAADGRRPARTLVYAAWDAEEQGLIGSTEWVEDNAEALDAQLVAYLNTDGNSRGFLSAGGSHTLERFVNEVAADVTDPQTGVPLTTRLRARLRVSDDPAQRAAADAPWLAISPLGSGSDYTPFLQHLGIASLNTSFGGEGPGGSYHTLYDTYTHYTRFRDPDFEYGVALAEFNGRATLRLANAPLLPFEFTALAKRIGGWLEEIETMTASMREETKRLKALLDDGVYALALDPQDTLGPPAPEAPVPFLNFAPLHNALARLEAAAADWDGLDVDPTTLDGRTLGQLNRLLYTSERTLTREAGLPGRPWFRHYVYAPGFYTGYGVKTLPAVREAVEERAFDGLDEHVARTADALDALSVRVERLVGILSRR
jgi:N-acetylated-alpha-linked acidic dipeptidase